MFFSLIPPSLKKIWWILFIGIALLVGPNIWLFPTAISFKEGALGTQLQSALWAKNLIESSATFQMDGALLSIVKDLELGAEDSDIVFQRLFRDYPNFEGLKFLDKSARVIEHYDDRVKITDHIEHGEWPDFFSTEMFQRVSSGDIYIGPVFFKKNIPFMEIAVPIHEGGVFSGALVGEVNLSFTWDVVREIKLSSSGKVYLADQMGNLLADPDPSKVITSIPILYRTVVRDIIGGKQEKVIGRYTNEKKEDAQATALFIEKFNWSVIVEEPVSEIFSVRKNMFLLAFVIMIAEMFLLGLLVKNSLSLVKTASDLERSKNALEEEKDKTMAIINNFTDGLLAFDSDNNLFLINPMAEDFFKVHGQTSAGMPLIKLAVLPGIKLLANLLIKEIDEGLLRKELPLRDDLFLEISAIPAKIGKEKLGTLVIAHDITREKKIEAMKTEFVTIAAHQLRTPLSAIKWTLKMFLDGDLGKITKEQDDFIKKTYETNERMIYLINDLLNVTKIEEGRYLYKPVPAEIEPIAQFVVSSYKEEAAKRKVELMFEKPVKKSSMVMIDVEKIRLAIQNLIDNAVKYTPKGGAVTVSLKPSAKEIEFSVKDTGVGIPENQRGRVFTKFFRAANVMKLETEGSGLGLFIAKNIIEAHGGKMRFESKEGEGTTFFFTLPIIT